MNMLRSFTWWNIDKVYTLKTNLGEEIIISMAIAKKT
jgi:hypothetical protein